MFIAAGAANNGQNDAKTRACYTKTNKDFVHLMGLRRDCKRGQDKSRRIHQRAENNGLAITDTFGDGPKNRLTNSPSKVLNCDGQ